MVFCQRLVSGSNEVVFVSLVGGCVVYVEVAVHLAHPVRVEGQGVHSGGLLLPDLLLRNQRRRAIEYGGLKCTAVCLLLRRECRPEEPIGVGRVHKRKLLRDALPGGGVKCESAMGVRCGRGALDGVHTDVIGGGEGDGGRIHARLLRRKLDGKLRRPAAISTVEVNTRASCHDGEGLGHLHEWGRRCDLISDRLVRPVQQH
mmetsp:Transcript_3083/g.6983  ORF Transcript_3083/g.6983 Transcript_3083/m.6983 type:complete len:202 (-) Transcript_3083:843-1448(-)